MSDVVIQHVMPLMLHNHQHQVTCLPACPQITGQRIEQHNRQLYAATARHLLLSRQQQQRIATTLALFEEMMAPLLRTRAQLQASLPAQLSLPPPTPPPPPPPSPTLPEAAAAAAAAAVPRLGGRFRRQEIVQQLQEAWRDQGRQQLRLVFQLQLLLRKEALLTFCCCMAIEGCLSWKQMGKFALSCFPHPFSPIALAQAVQAQLQQQQQQ
ncbi:hypothetical protein OEZ85_013898 [Tetradesmus obliquus]|uniref:Uncharacterized protein n=1 Tax=Tetradesmus obliquus TaxID=3088 RepID=A0ABY8U7A5_TETOB|nr:hypothetical protein OEZ85_013898 [Tetradesmus obliquus]